MSREKVRKLLAWLKDCPPATSPQEAWNYIDQGLKELPAFDRYGKQWIIPSLYDESSKDYGSGRAIRLIGHLVYFNANGAYRIVDLADGGAAILDMPGSDGLPFSEIPDYRMPLVL